MVRTDVLHLKTLTVKDATNIVKADAKNGKYSSVDEAIEEIKRLSDKETITDNSIYDDLKKIIFD